MTLPFDPRDFDDDDQVESLSSGSDQSMRNVRCEYGNHYFMTGSLLVGTSGTLSSQNICPSCYSLLVEEREAERQKEEEEREELHSTLREELQEILNSLEEM